MWIEVLGIFFLVVGSLGFIGFFISGIDDINPRSEMNKYFAGIFCAAIAFCGVVMIDYAEDKSIRAQAQEIRQELDTITKELTQ